MILTRTVTKKILENIVHETFSNFGSVSSSSLLDSLKFLGFYYATNAGISINIEDLKTPNLKKDFLSTANEEMKEVSEQWQQGFLSDTERFQRIIDSWNFATESLKDRIVEYYQNFDPANNLYIMAFSGARGNMSQVRQLVGMRGLMSDQEGKIIDLPIQTNFREGLSSIDYIISSYGARKGIVDTALKTADSGYLTRRLIYIAQDLIIRETDCETKIGVIVILKSTTSFKNIIGRYLLSSTSLKESNHEKGDKGVLPSMQDFILTKEILDTFKQKQPLSLKIRSPLTCSSNGSVCQKCYGWDLAQNKVISLGEAVGIIAAQSIGEPGTQLTMRTFHTGGIFTSELVKQVLAPFSGRLIIPASLKKISARSNHGVIVSKIQQEATILFINWKGVKKEVSLKIGSFLYFSKSGFVKKDQLISEYSDTVMAGERRLKPIYSSFSGEIFVENLQIRHISRENKKPKVKVNQDAGVLWLASGKVVTLPKESKYQYKESLRKTKAFANLILTSPFSGITFFEKEKLTISTFDKKVTLDLSNLTPKLKNCRLQFSILSKNYQYIDKHTVLGILSIFPKIEGKIYSTRYKKSKYLHLFLFITDDDVWKINSDQTNNFNSFPSKKTIIRKGMSLNGNSTFNQSGYFLKKDGFKMIFQNALPLFLSRGTILNYTKGFVFENQILATLVNYTQQTEDIVQGLPKIEELIEARIPKNKAYLSKRPGIFTKSTKDKVVDSIIFFDSETIKYSYRQKASTNIEKVSKKAKKQSIQIAHSLHELNQFILFEDKLWKGRLIHPNFKPEISETSSSFCFVWTKEEENPLYLVIDGKKSSTKWEKVKENSYISSSLYKFSNKTLEKWKELPRIRTNYQNKNGDLILKLKGTQYLFLEQFNPIEDYKFPENAKTLFKAGHFVDIGEPITEGTIDPHDLLSILFDYHCVLDGTLMGTIKSLNKFQLLVVNSIQAIYQSQGVNISSKHIEIIVRQMTAKVVIEKSGDTPFLPGETIRLSLIMEIYKAMQKVSKQKEKSYRLPQYTPLFLSTTRSSLNKDGFLSAAGFQETKRILAKSALEGTSDWLRGLKECIIIGRLIPAGSSFLNYKNYLDNIYLFKD